MEGFKEKLRQRIKLNAFVERRAGDGFQVGTKRLAAFAGLETFKEQLPKS